MENKISRLENFIVQDKGSNGLPEKRCRFYYLENDYLWKEFDVKGHYTLEGAFEIAKNIILNDLIKMALKESIRSLDLKSKHFHFEKDGKIEDLRDYVFDLDTLDENSGLFKAYKKLLLENFNDDMIWYYFLADAIKGAKIHDDTDKKTLYNHYFDGLEEFKSRQSFLEYSSTYIGDYDYNIKPRRIYENFFIYGDYHCIDNSITREDIRNFARDNNYVISEDILLSNLFLWELFGYYYGKNNGLNEAESISFGCSLASFFSEGYYSDDIFKDYKNKKPVEIDKHFNQRSILEAIDAIIYRTIDGNLTEHTREIFFTIFDIYRNGIQEFEKKTKRLEFRVSERIYKHFMELEGKSKSDKLYSLMTLPKEEVNESLLPDIYLDKDSLEEWKENNKSTAKVFFKDEWFSGHRSSLNEKYGGDKEITIVDAKGGINSPEEQAIIDDMDRVMEEEYKNMMEEEAEYAREELEWMKIHKPEEYERSVEFSRKFDSLSPEERELILKEMFKGSKKEGH